ncbi:hypothetical protein [Psychromonas sp. Urea-02u-13]|uniref:hypothetical protein n=1 Tax=Psychromonas sp. Urea-02u-13 TaxID=2058326 RepID=UPI000C34DC9E|nr:hypothetical protein [Psychromonas sp. Urea-02u-13]PKG38818.1 hypothetical protein CXF74_11685 [Psychromonas sp. Urea-02u-13]
MFKKLSIISSFALLAACSSNPVSDNYVDDVVIQKNSHDTYTQIVGKEIIPVDLLEHNLALKVSVLDVVANIANDSTQSVESVVNFDIQYSEAKNETNTEKNEQQDFVKYDLVTVTEMPITLESTSASRDCDDKICTVTQSFSFPIATELLQNGQQDGVKFLLEQNENGELQLETMIPGRYLTALFAQ